MFSILATSEVSGTGEANESGTYENAGADSSLMKTVRVVTTVEYYLEK